MWENQLKLPQKKTKYLILNLDCKIEFFLLCLKFLAICNGGSNYKFSFSNLRLSFKDRDLKDVLHFKNVRIEKTNCYVPYSLVPTFVPLLFLVSRAFTFLLLYKTLLLLYFKSYIKSVF